MILNSAAMFAVVGAPEFERAQQQHDAGPDHSDGDDPGDDMRQQDRDKAKQQQQDAAAQDDQGFLGVQFPAAGEGSGQRTAEADGAG